MRRRKLPMLDHDFQDFEVLLFVIDLCMWQVA